MDRDQYEARGAEICEQWTELARAGLAAMLVALRPSIVAWNAMYTDFCARERAAEAERRQP